MTVELFASNRAVTTVSSGGTTAPSSGTTETWTVGSSAGFGTAATGISQFHVADPALPSELIAVTNVSGTTWTVTRGAESTTPVAHAPGFLIDQVASAGWLGTLAPLAGTARRVPYRASAWRQLFQTGHGWTAGGGGLGSSNLNDTSIFIRGTQCATITTNGTGVQASLSITAQPAQDLTGKMLRFTFYVPDITHLSNIGFYVGTSSFGSNFLWNAFTSTPGSLNYVQSGEWVEVCVSWADLSGAAGYTISGSGAPSTKTGFTDMRLAVYDDAAGPVTIHYQSVEIVPDTSATFPNGLVTVTFDDSWQSVYDLARPLMDTYGWGGSLCTIADQVGQSGRLTLAELQTLQDFSGWEVAGHAFTLAAHNAGYETLTAAQVNTEMRNMKAWLLANGFPASTFAYPMGFFSPTTDGVPVDQIAADYFPAARTIISELNATWPPPMPLRMFAVTGVSSFAGGVPVSTLTAANGPLVRCAQQGAWLQLSLHQIVTSTPTSATQLLQSDLSTLLAFISGLGMTVLPAGSVTGYYS